MLYFQFFVKRILVLLFITLSFTHLSFGQKPKLSSTSWRDNWKINVETGFGALLSEVPEKYLDRINNVNIPLKVPGATEIISLRKGLDPHFELGYQFEYLRINGNVKQGNSNYNVLTEGLGNSFQVLYNLKKTNEFRPRFNYFGYYKIGAISMKNFPKQIMQDGSQVPSGPLDANTFKNNVAIITGLGIGINYQFTNNLSLTSTFELNRSSDAVAEIYKIHKIFYHSSHTVNNYSSLTFGFCYAYNFSKRKNSAFYSSKTETDKKLLQAKIARKKGKSSTANLPAWYNHKNGK